MTLANSISKFPLGQVVATRTLLAQVGPADAVPALARHANGDWGEVCEYDRSINDFAVTAGDRILSAYTSSSGVRFWIITEADRSSTTLLLPDDY